MRIAFLVFLVALSSCQVSEEMIQRKEVYCSGFYQSIRNVARTTVNTVSTISTGASVIPFDVCQKIDEVAGEGSVEGKS